MNAVMMLIRFVGVRNLIKLMILIAKELSKNTKTTFDDDAVKILEKIAEGQHTKEVIDKYFKN